MSNLTIGIGKKIKIGKFFKLHKIYLKNYMRKSLLVRISNYFHIKFNINLCRKYFLNNYTIYMKF